MSDRLKSMQRIVAMQAQRKRLAEWKLIEIENRKAALVTARTALGDFVETESLVGPLAVLALRQTRRLAEREADTGIERDRQRGEVQAAERRHRLAERITETVAAEDRVVEDRRSLEVLIEGAVARQQAEEGGVNRIDQQSIADDEASTIRS
ncbi:hypothetical protein P7D22_04095 [Lichenihabitans sp. Uapishka_5]|uniref:hypothetical protein n=1 Tax=Lichenihabitans sp. Uapishka_5 TaxID=3037302 RepID=UPI0029E81073|nr:hypothetical protein [Lichenihabitans sp. Uapishka_5]MDX7950358.1 hypothetical protein [Lichenihabitans sp. Uapishka_5]